MSRRWAGAGAGVAALGAWMAVPVPRWPAVLALLALALGHRRERGRRWHAVLALFALGTLASGQAARSWAGLSPPAPAAVEGWVTLATDPDPVEGALRVEVKVGQRRAEAWVRGPVADRLSDRLAGEQVDVSGRISPLPERARWRLASHHVSARLTLSRVGPSRAGSPAARVANRLRRVLDRGAASMSFAQRALFTGVVLGDDRDQDDATIADFRASGLSHLLAVSGQNVAFVLAVAQPVLRRLKLMSRLAASLALVAGFATLTRWEPSVLRAAAMAAVALVATTASGRRLDPVIVLATVVAGLILIDPLLVHSLGFQLSAAACAGITLLSGRIASALPGPAWMVEPLALTISAQAGVAPLLLPVFGSLPLASLPSNLLAGPIAGLLMGWGLVAGLLAGFVGPPLAGLLHLPTRGLLVALAAIAHVGARLPLAQVRLGHAVAIAVMAAVAASVSRIPRRALALALVPAAVVAGLAVADAGPPRRQGGQIVAGARLWRSGVNVLVLDGARAGSLADRLRVEGVKRLAVVVSRRGSSADVAALTLLRGRVAIGTVVAPDGGRVAGWHPFAGAVVRAGMLDIVIDRADRPMDVRVALRRSGPPSGRGRGR